MLLGDVAKLNVSIVSYIYKNLQFEDNMWFFKS